MTGLLPRLRRFARGLAKDPEKADDLVQEACERALERLNQVGEGTRLDSWMYRIIYTRWIDGLRRKKTRRAHLVLLTDRYRRQAAESQANDSRLNAMMDIRSALNALPEEHRAAILLVAVEGYGYAEAASILDLPQGTVASRVARARAMLVDNLSQRNKEILKIVEQN